MKVKRKKLGTQHTTNSAEDILRDLLATEYEVETRGKRRVAATAPTGEGKYSIVKHDNDTEHAYVLELPEVPDLAQREFEIKKSVN